MYDLVDFTGCRRVLRPFGGSDRKFGIEYGGDVYMIKFSENHAKRSEISTSYVNNVISEFISSHISESIGIPTHKTILGLYNNEVVVACKDFRKSGDSNLEFAELIRSKYDSNEVKRSVRLNQIYDTLMDADILSETMKVLSIERYWDTFVVDALVGNFDRHIGNWGYLVNNDSIRLAPVYDYGSTLYPQLSDYGMSEILNSEYERLKRCYVFPSPALFITDEKVGKVGYYDMLASGYDKNCTEAVKRVFPHVDITKITAIIDNTPLISDVRKEFYKTMLTLRNGLILEKAYNKCLWNGFDEDSLYRIQNGIQYSEDMLTKGFNIDDVRHKTSHIVK